MDELERVHTTLCDRYGIGDNNNILQIAFGLAERDGKADRRRGESICFYVRKKQAYETLQEPQRIRSPIRVRVKRGPRFCELVAPVDVLEIDIESIALTGRPIRYGNSGTATTGTLLAWRHPQRRRLAWGVLTVGHIFPSHLKLPDERINVEVLSATGQVLPARLVARADKADLDAALAIVRRDDLVEARIISQNFRARGRGCKTQQQLLESAGRGGFTMPTNRRRPFRYERYLFDAPIFASLLGFVPRHVIHASAENDLFQPGTSGSPWSIGRLAAGMQFASLHPEFRQGFGQSLFQILRWSRSAIAALNELPEHQIDLRFVRYF